jgi:hypothetical protein
LVARLPEPGNQGALGAIVIEIEIHPLAGRPRAHKAICRGRPF